MQLQVHLLSGTGHSLPPRQELLYREEYVQIIEACHELGVRSLRITGGEPTLYPELDALIEQVGGIGLEDIAMTTNGWSLDLDRARHWRASGLKRLTFSLDSLREDRMSEITRSKTSVRQVFEAIATARSAGFPRPKVNVVVMRHINDDEVVDFATTARQHDLDIRFIEFMPLDSARDWDRGQVVTAEEIRRKIDAVWPLTRSDDGTPHSTSNNWSFSDGQPGRIGFIAPVSRLSVVPAIDSGSLLKDGFAPVSSVMTNGISNRCCAEAFPWSISGRSSSMPPGTSNRGIASVRVISSNRPAACRPSVVEYMRHRSRESAGWQHSFSMGTLRD